MPDAPAIHPLRPDRPPLRPCLLALALAVVPLTSSCNSPTAAQTNGPVGAHTHDASAIVSGVLADDRLSPTVKWFQRDTVRFPGVVAWGGGPYLGTSDLDQLLTGAAGIQQRLGDLETAFADFSARHTHDAGDLTEGTLPDARLSGNVALLSGSVTRFTGALAWGGGVLLGSSSSVGSGGSGSGTVFTDQPNVFTQPQTFSHRLMNAQLTGVPLEGSGTIGLRFDRVRETDLSPLGIAWSLSGGERWALGLDQTPESHPDFVLLYNTGYGDILRVADGAHFQFGAGVGETPTDHLMFLNDRPGSGNTNVLNMQTSGDAERFIRTQNPGGAITFAVGIDGATGIGRDLPSDPGLTLDVAGPVRAQSYDTWSDARLKEDVRPLPSVLERVARLQAVQFRWKESGQEDVGVLAQEVEALFPELVSEHDGVKSVDYAGLTAVLLGAVAELAALHDHGGGG